MKNRYEEEIFQFFTQPENFETMLKVADQAETVCKRLIQQFWAEVEAGLKEALSNAGNDWRVCFSDNWEYRWNKLWVYRQEWCQVENYPVISVAFEDIQPRRQPYLGVHIGFDNKAFDGVNIKKDIVNLRALKEYKTDSNNYWAVWKNLPFQLEGYESLVRLLPENRKQTSQNVLKDTLELLGLVKDEVNPLIEKHRLKG